MAGRLIGGWTPAQDSNGLAMSGAKLHTYVPGTTTNKAAYTTAALNVAHTNPVVADSAGRFPELWADDGEQYDLKWTDSSGVQIQLFEDIMALGSESAGEISRDFDAGGRLSISGASGQILFRAGPPSPDDTGGTLVLEGYAGTPLDALIIDASAISFTSASMAFGDDLLNTATREAAHDVLLSAEEKLGNGTFSASSGPTFDLDPSDRGFNRWRLEVTGLIPSGTPTIGLQFSFDNGSSWKAGTDNSYVLHSRRANTTASSDGGTQILLNGTAMQATASKANTIEIEIFGPKATGFGCAVFSRSNYWGGGGNQCGDDVAGQIIPGYGTPTHVRFLPSAGTISGAYAIYGRRGL